MIKVRDTKFNVGQIIHHRLFDYRGVIVDVAPEFMGTEEWYDTVAKTHPPKDQPWYHVLVDEGDFNTYVSEQNLEPDLSNDSVDHPLVRSFFKTFENGKYKKQLDA